MLHAGKILYGSDASKVIYYHDIHSKHSFTNMSTHVELFRKHIEILRKESFHTVELIKKKTNEVEITFDDGFRGIYENFSTLQDLKVPVRIFLIVDFIGKKEYLSKNEINELLACGLVRIGSHTLTHENLDKMHKDKAQSEVCDSKKKLEDLFGIEIDTLCYPRGKFSDEIVGLAKSCGYARQYSCLPGDYFDSFKPDILNRSLVQNANKEEFRLILHGGDKIFFKRYLKQQYRKNSL